jgi:hypothetical protein
VHHYNILMIIFTNRLCKVQLHWELPPRDPLIHSDIECHAERLEVLHVLGCGSLQPLNLFSQSMDDAVETEIEKDSRERVKVEEGICGGGG